jgi:aminoglycoside 6'-N-acetyltransferase
MLPTLTDGRVALRPLHERDADALAAFVAQPGVSEWWGPEGSAGRSAAGFAEEARDQIAFAIEVDGALAGWLGFTEELEPDYRHAGLDILLAPAHQGAGLGPVALRLAARWLIGERGHHRLTIDPARANARAIRAYEAVGFRTVGVMRQYERGADGEWHDGLLMDMLADELDTG